MRARNKSEGARDAGGRADPRASASRDTEAERRSRPGPPSCCLSVPQVRLLSSVPRAVFIGLLRETPGGRLKHFRLPRFPSLWKLDHRFRVDRCAFGLAPGAQRSPNPCDPRSRAGTSRLGPPVWGVHLGTPNDRPPHPPRVSDADQTPSVGAGCEHG